MTRPYCACDNSRTVDLTSWILNLELQFATQHLSRTKCISTDSLNSIGLEHTPGRLIYAQRKKLASGGGGVALLAFQC